MKKNEVPQDDSSIKDNKFKELCYAVDEDGNYVTAKSTGWSPKTIALDNALEDINERVADAKQRVLNNETSPIEYYMELHKMDLPILSSYVGIWQWRVKRHLKPKVFQKLSDKVLKKYASVFEISIKELKSISNGN